MSDDQLQRVLDAADEVLAREGARALTTTRIARVADVQVGSLDRFFPDAESIVDAVAIRYWDDFEDLVAGVAKANEQAPLDDPVGALVDTLAAGFRSRPGFRALWYGGLRTERVRNATRAARGRFARAIERILAVHWPDADEGSIAGAARMVVLVGDGLLREAFRGTPQGNEALLTETKFLLGAYLDARLGGREA